MKRYFIFIILSQISFIANSQDSLKNYELGYYFDINNQIINGYFDIDYEPEETVKVSYTIGESYTPGYYYTLNFEKISGELSYSVRNTYFTFLSKNGSPGKTIKPDDCVGYVIGRDSFAVIQNFLIQREIGGFECNRKEFAEVIEEVDSITFYKHTKVGINGIVTTFLYSYKNSNKFISFPKDHLKFIETAKPIFSNHPNLMLRIQRAKFTEKDIPVIVKILKYKKKYDEQEKIFYNSSWDEVDNANEYLYYANINSIKDSLFHMSFFFKNGTPIYDGYYSSFYPHRKNGEFTWYYPNGSIRKKSVYINNNPGSIETFFKNGQIHHRYKLHKKDHVYSQIFNLKGDSLLNNLGNGFEVFFDSIGNREITNEYVNKKLVKSYYFDSNKRKISIMCDKPARIKNFKMFQNIVNDLNSYPLNSVANYNHGIALVKFIVETDGTISDYKIIKSIDSYCDYAISRIFSNMKTDREWKPAKDFGENVVQEIIVPIDFSILGFSRYRNNYNNSFMIHQMMMQQQHQMMMNQINMAPKF